MVPGSKSEKNLEYPPGNGKIAKKGAAGCMKIAIFLPSSKNIAFFGGGVGGGGVDPPRGGGGDPPKGGVDPPPPPAVDPGMGGSTPPFWPISNGI